MSPRIQTKKFIFVSWIGALLFGLGGLFIYSNRPGPKGLDLKKWPSSSALTAPDQLPTFVLFLHPECSCSIATVGELERLLPLMKNKIQVEVVLTSFMKDRKPASNSKVIKLLKDLPNIKIYHDQNSKDALTFGALTFGQSYIYNIDHELVFSGGLTPSRGHMGDSAARDFIVSWLNKKNKQTNFFSEVFGCELFGDKA